MTAAPILRLATAADLPAINAIYNHYILHSTATYQIDPITPDQRQAWFHSHGPAHPVTVLELPEKRGQTPFAPLVVAWASLSPFRAFAAYAHTVENSVYVHPDHLRRGYGKLLLADSIARGRALHHHSIIAVIDSAQTPSLALHQSLGFLPAGHLRQAGRKFDQWLDVIYLQLML